MINTLILRFIKHFTQYCIGYILQLYPFPAVGDVEGRGELLIVGFIGSGMTLFSIKISASLWFPGVADAVGLEERAFAGREETGNLNSQREEAEERESRRERTP